MRLSQKTLIKLKAKNKKLKPNKYKKLKRESLRGQIKGTINRPRLSIYLSNKNIYAQIIDDINSETLLSYSSLNRSLKLISLNSRTCNASKLIGEIFAELSFLIHIRSIIFDRGPYLYHGRIKAFADGARSNGLLDF